MNALELAECIESDPDGNGDLSVSLMLRKQDAAIKQLREVLVKITEASSANLAAITAPLVNGALEALAATEEFAK